MSLDGRVAIVTGGSKGIGAAIAQRLASAGATVVLAACSIDAAADDLPGTAREVIGKIEANGGKAVAIACDVEDAESRAHLIRGVIECFGRIDILINNAGRAILEPHENWKTSDLRSQAEQYIYGPIDLIMQALPHMKRQGQGWIVNLGSSSGMQVKGVDVDPPFGSNLAFYGGLKAMVHRYSTSLATELLKANIAVHVVAPVGAIETPGTTALGLVTPAMADRFEPVEHIAEAALALAERPAAERTGIVAMSYKWLDKIGRSTRSLDGRSVVEAR
jgi:NAD(P)-dependent dehydrogenase (short-subunit alcohol dehydrogenase family)